jgi:hypothetical protein
MIVRAGREIICKPPAVGGLAVQAGRSLIARMGFVDS